nr:type ISP restriction/modification enzyme [Oceanobacillus picturae]
MGEGSNNIGKVYINEKQYFEKVDEEVWSYEFGGYQVCGKWLKSRKHRVLAYDELVHFQRIVSMVKKTIQLEYSIDDVIKCSGGWPLQ